MTETVHKYHEKIEEGAVFTFLELTECLMCSEHTTICDEKNRYSIIMEAATESNELPIFHPFAATKFTSAVTTHQAANGKFLTDGAARFRILGYSDPPLAGNGPKSSIEFVQIGPQITGARTFIAIRA
jgi:hypothetical protein